VFSIFPDLENIGLDTLIRQIGQVVTEILRILVWRLLISIKINFMNIAQTSQGNTLANLDQEGPNVKKTAKICYADGKTRFSQNKGSGALTITLSNASHQRLRRVKFLD